MTASEVKSVAPLLVLGLGNPLLADDGAGLALLDLLRPELAEDPNVELVDGGTQGVMLLGLFEGRRALLLLDAVQRGERPGTTHLERHPEQLRAARGFGAHGGNASELLASARMLALLPDEVVLVGIEPAEIRTRIGLSPPVLRGLQRARAIARREVRDLLAHAVAKEPARCTS